MKYVICRICNKKIESAVSSIFGHICEHSVVECRKYETVNDILR
jgi:hypothetical protein